MCMHGEEGGACSEKITTDEQRGCGICEPKGRVPREEGEDKHRVTKGETLKRTWRRALDREEYTDVRVGLYMIDMPALRELG